MGKIQVLKFDGEFHPWETALTNLIRNSGTLTRLIETTDIDIMYCDINALISFYLKPLDNHRSSLKSLLPHIKVDTIFIISFLGEGIHHRMIGEFINDLIYVGVEKKNIRVLYSTFFDHPTFIKCESFSHFFIKCPVINHEDSNDYLNTIPTKHFLCLMRRTKPERVVFLNNFKDLDWFYDRDILDVSFGVGDPVDDAESQVDLMFFDSSKVDDEDQHKSINPEMITQLFNIVVETHITINNHQNGWGYITEKSIKPFYYCQIPIWMAQPKTVSIMREIGFDVFDDILDGHPYDVILNDDERIVGVMDLINSIKIKYNKQDISSLKSNLQDRIRKNRELLFKLDFNYIKKFEDHFLNLIT